MWMIELAILYDNHARAGLLPGWGFSAAVRTANSTVLFDCGADRLVLSHNAETLGIAPRDIAAIVISHEHCDHRGGLSAVMHDRLTLYVPKAFARRRAVPSNRGVAVRPVGGSLEIAVGIRSLGQIGRAIPEQALLVDAGAGPALITGCAHPGIVRLAEHAAQLSGRPPELLVGGFHLLRQEPDAVRAITARLLRLGVRRVAPCHCTGDVATSLFREAFGDRFIPVAAGTRLALD